MKSRVLTDLSIKIGEMVFRTFVYFLELFWEVFPQLFPKWFDTHVRNIFKLKWETWKFILEVLEMNNKITYHREGDYLIPDLSVKGTNSDYHIGLYGMLRLEY